MDCNTSTLPSSSLCVSSSFSWSCCTRTTLALGCLLSSFGKVSSWVETRHIVQRLSIILLESTFLTTKAKLTISSLAFLVGTFIVSAVQKLIVHTVTKGATAMFGSRAGPFFDLLKVLALSLGLFGQPIRLGLFGSKLLFLVRLALCNSFNLLVLENQTIFNLRHVVISFDHFCKEIFWSGKRNTSFLAFGSSFIDGFDGSIVKRHFTFQIIMNI
mmetsp:Transcript_24236/g.39563  ORF Transcript_24236/g.39563 Transcript_24236/m.39563 type:complete len:215 (+) Transcript_24236:155-799(+)